MTDAIPHKPITDWHRQRAAELANEFTRAGGWSGGDFGSNATPRGSMAHAFLQHIADHEDPPIDPDLLAAREIVARNHSTRAGNVSLVESVLAGQFDDDYEVRAALAGIKHGRINP